MFEVLTLQNDIKLMFLIGVMDLLTVMDRILFMSPSFTTYLFNTKSCCFKV